jgi:hypothetical protein
MDQLLIQNKKIKKTISTKRLKEKELNKPKIREEKSSNRDKKNK